MAKYSNRELEDFILASDKLDNDAKSQLVHLLRSNKSYGLVWERKPEESYELLKSQIPVFIEDNKKAIHSEDKNSPNHVLIEGDNLHALTVLCYTHEGKFDAIYIDPPYNSGATDWRYNNDYVDKDDSYRHSKWLSMMENRLKVAKKLLNPENSVLIVTIDEKEYLHLGCMLEEMFPEARMQMVSTVINPKGVARNGFSRNDEYIYFVMIGESCPARLPLSDEWSSSAAGFQEGDNSKLSPNPEWTSMMRRGSNSSREHSPGCYYPIYADPEKRRIVQIGFPIPKGEHKADEIEGLVQILPIRTNGSEGCWQVSANELKERMEQGRIRLGKPTPYGFVVNYLPDGAYKELNTESWTIVGRAEDNSIIAKRNDLQARKLRIAPTQWKIASHNASENGTTLLSSILGNNVFSYPKSLYAVQDTLRFFVSDKPDALILDFFAGSGTTMHATMLLNNEDGGHRRCFLVTNNENNICEEVTYERNRRVITGYTTPKGIHVEGLKNNSLRYFRTEFRDRVFTHQSKRDFVFSTTDILRIKENCYLEQHCFGGLNILGKDKMLRFFEEDGRKLLVIYDYRVVPFVAKEIEGMSLKDDELSIYIFTDGSYPYVEDFRTVIDGIKLTALPYAINQALKYVLPSADDINIENANLSEEEKEELISEAIESENNEQ